MQLFDSWAGSLSAADYERLVAPWSRRILAAIRDAGAPAIHFAAVGANLLEALAEGADVVGVDCDAVARTPPAVGWAPRAVQGNLDPARLAASWPVARAAVDAILAANGGRPGHVFNTGHAVPRDTDPARLRDIVAHVHERSASAPPSTATVPSAGVPA